MKPLTDTPYLDEQINPTDESLDERTRKEVERLLQASLEAQDHPTALDYAQRAVEALPDDPQVQESVQRNVFTHLNQDAFVAFLAETPKHYVISFRTSRPIMIPKARVQPEIFPSPKRTESERLVGMLGWVLLGLVPAGIGAMILSPWMAGHAIHIIWRNGPTPQEKRLAWVTIALAALLGFLGMFFTLLLILHVIG